MIKCLLAILVISLATTGCWGCGLMDIGVGTSKTGKMVAGKPEWTVVVTNRCKCAVTALILSCPEFETVETPDPIHMVGSDGTCLIERSAPIAPGTSVQFTYAWDHAFSFIPKSMVHSC